MISCKLNSIGAGAVLLLAVASSSTTVVAAGGMERRDGSTITVSTTQFNPALTNQGGTTNAAGTFNVSPLATSTSYQFETLQQTSTFQIGPVNTQAPNSGSGNNNNGGSAGSGGSGGNINSGNVGGGTVVVTATAPTSTVNMVSNTAGNTASGTASSGSGGPTLALGVQNSNVAAATFGDSTKHRTMLALSSTAVLLATFFGALII